MPLQTLEILRLTEIPPGRSSFSMRLGDRQPDGPKAKGFFFQKQANMHEKLKSQIYGCRLMSDQPTTQFKRWENIGPWKCVDRQGTAIFPLSKPTHW